MCGALGVAGRAPLTSGLYIIGSAMCASCVVWPSFIVGGSWKTTDDCAVSPARCWRSADVRSRDIGASWYSRTRVCWGGGPLGGGCSLSSSDGVASREMESGVRSSMVRSSVLPTRPIPIRAARSLSNSDSKRFFDAIVPGSPCSACIISARSARSARLALKKDFDSRNYRTVDTDRSSSAESVAAARGRLASSCAPAMGTNEDVGQHRRTRGQEKKRVEDV